MSEGVSRIDQLQQSLKSSLNGISVISPDYMQPEETMINKFKNMEGRMDK